jgi:hypothetical protein
MTRQPTSSFQRRSRQAPSDSPRGGVRGGQSHRVTRLLAVALTYTSRSLSKPPHPASACNDERNSTTTSQEFDQVRRRLKANWPNLTIDDEIWRERLAPYPLAAIKAAIDGLPSRYLPGLADVVSRLPARGPVVDIDRDALIARRKQERQADEDRHYAQQDAEHRERERAILKRQGNETYEQWEARVTAALTGSSDDAIR